MITVSNDFKTAMKQPIKELNGYLEINEENKITSADDLVSFKVSCETGMCKTAMRKLECKLLGEHNLLNQWVHVGFGVRVANGTFEYLDYGSFLITETTTVKDTGITTIVAYDKMINTMTSYQKLNVEYPINLYDYTLELCKACGLELVNTTFVHADWIITQDLWENIEGITYRDILVQIAQVTASTCIITNDDKIYFKYLTSTEEELTYQNMKKLKLEPMYGEINSVVISRTPAEDNIYMRDEESIAINGLTEFKIENNEIIDKDREGAMTPIYNSLHGIKYYPFETTTEGLGWYEIADSFNIINDTGDVFNTSLFNFNITIDGSIKEILKTVADTKTQTQYQYATTIDKRVKNTEIIVNKQEGTIIQIVQDTSENKEKITVVEQNINSISSTVSKTEKTLEQLDENTVKNDTYNTYVETVESTIEQLNNQIEFKFIDAVDRTSSLEDVVTQNQELIEEYIRFSGALIELGRIGNDFTAELSNTQLAFKQNGIAIAYISNNKLYITDAELKNQLTIGKFAFIPRSNGNLSFKWIGG